MDIGWSHLISGTSGGMVVAAGFLIRQLARGKVKISFGANGNANGQTCRFQCDARELKPTLDKLTEVLQSVELTLVRIDERTRS